LPELLKKIPELQTPKTTSLNPFEIIRCLRLKVWDVESQQMVGLTKEAIVRKNNSVTNEVAAKF
jgi:hypothetical protein